MCSMIKLCFSLPPCRIRLCYRHKLLIQNTAEKGCTRDVTKSLFLEEIRHNHEICSVNMYQYAASSPFATLVFKYPFPCFFLLLLLLLLLLFVLLNEQRGESKFCAHGCGLQLFVARLMLCFVLLVFVNAAEK